MEVTFRNPLKVSLALSNLSLLWSFSQDDASKPEEPPVTNEEELAPGVGHQRMSHGLERPIEDFDALFLFQSFQKNGDVITAEVIQEFLISPDETKMVQ